MCHPLLFLTLLTKGDSSTASRRLVIKSSLLLLGTYYISDLQDAHINKPQGPREVKVVVENPVQESVALLPNNGANTTCPHGGDAAKRGQRRLQEAAKKGFTEVIPGDVLRWEQKIVLRGSREWHKGDK